MIRSLGKKLKVVGRGAVIMVLAAILVVGDPIAMNALAVTEGDVENRGDANYYTHNGIIFYDGGKLYCGTDGQPVNGDVSTSQGEEDNAKIIIGIAKTMNLGEKGALIGIMTAITESRLRIYANSGIPVSLTHPNVQATGKDHDSVGVFQQRVSTGWSTFGNYTNGKNPEKDKNITFQLMDVAYSAQAFFGTPSGAKLPDGLEQPSALKKGLQNKDGWQTMDPWLAAQKVQISFDPTGGNYKASLPRAEKLMAKLYESSPAIPLPIPLSGGSAPTNTGNITGNCTTGAAASGTVIQVAVTYSWPEYRDPDDSASRARQLKPAYASAVKAARAKDPPEYVGGNRYQAVDCGGFVTRVMRDSGADPKYNAYQSNVVSQRKYLNEHPEKYEKLTNLSVDKPPQPGDIWINSNASHTYMYVGSVENFKGNSASASLDERAPMASNAYGYDETWYRLKAAPPAQ